MKSKIQNLAWRNTYVAEFS